MNISVPITARDIVGTKIASLSDNELESFAKEFSNRGFVRIPNFLPKDFLANLIADCDGIVERQGKDKNLLMKSTGNTPRRMRTVGQHILAKYSQFIPDIYASEVLRGFLETLAGQSVHRAPWPPEEFVLSNLYRNGDTHGWHWDDYSFAFVLYLKAPDISQGGFVQTCGGGSWDKKNPKVNETLLNGVIHTHLCEAGDAYFLNAQKFLHRVTPIANDGERLIINMTWASQADLDANMTHETNDILFARSWDTGTMTTSSVREELYRRLPDAVQPFITWISGIPAAAQQNCLPLTSIFVISLGVISILIGFGSIYAAITGSGSASIMFYLFGFCCIAGGARRLDVLIIHQTLHSKVLATPRQNKILGEILTTILLRTPYDKNRKEHLGHHRAPCDEDDVDVIFLRQAGIMKANRKEKLYLRVFMTALSPVFHLRFFYNRLVANFITAQPFYRLMMSWGYAASLLAPTVFYGTSYLFALAVFWLIPLSVGFQMSNFLYTATKHRWWLFGNQSVRGKEKRDMLSYARVCCSQAPQNDNFCNWVIWWLEALLVHVPVRLFVIVGDTLQHNLHHVAPNCDWPNSAYERQKYNIRAPERFSEVWGGMLAHLKECNLEGSVYVDVQKSIHA